MARSRSRPTGACASRERRRSSSRSRGCPSDVRAELRLDDGYAVLLPAAAPSAATCAACSSSARRSCIPARARRLARVARLAGLARRRGNVARRGPPPPPERSSLPLARRPLERPHHGAGRARHRHVPEPVGRARPRLPRGRGRGDGLRASCSAKSDRPRLAQIRRGVGEAYVGGGSETHVIECSLRHRSGTWLQFEVQHTDLLQDEHVRGIVLNSRDVSERKAFEDQLAHQAFHDPVTSLANRALFADRVQHSIMRSIRGGRAIGVMFIDLDDFKTINDSLGHAAGDTVLREVARRLQAAVRPADTVARFGGDEFADPAGRGQGLGGGGGRRRTDPSRARAPVRRRRQARLSARERRHLPRR